MEACTASLPSEAAEPIAQREAAVVAAAPDAQQEAAVAAAAPDAQREAAVAAAEPIAQREAAVVAAEPDAQQEAAAAAAESVAQQQSAAMQWGVRPFAATTVGLQRTASCSPMAPMVHQILAVAARFWLLATPSLVRTPE